MADTEYKYYNQQVRYVIVMNDGTVQELGANGKHHAEQYLEQGHRLFMVETKWTEVKKDG